MTARLVFVASLLLPSVAWALPPDAYHTPLSPTAYHTSITEDKPHETPVTSVVVDSRRRVVVYSDHGCASCLSQLRSETAELGALGYSVSHRDGGARPTALRSLELPFMHFTAADSPSGWRVRSGWFGAEEFERLFRSHDKPVLLPTIRKTQSVQRVAHRPLIFRGQAEWSWPGDLRQHLTTGPHGLSRATVDSWSDSQCIARHNADHNGSRSRSRRG